MSAVTAGDQYRPIFMRSRVHLSLYIHFYECVFASAHAAPMKRIPHSDIVDFVTLLLFELTRALEMLMDNGMCKEIVSFRTRGPLLPTSYTIICFKLHTLF